MINFLKCDAKAIIKLILDLSYQERNKIAHKVIEVDNNTVYRFTVADNMSGMKTLTGRITAFTMCPEREVMSFVNQNVKPSVVDTITVDCSADNMSGIKTINICDIRSIEELRDTGFEEIERKDITTFK
jgi:hypothetical protein|nr:MAG TPA: hypothetical protein [Caudoviricetes sp.]